jgi:MFS transporter, putative metabolite:H+ symporter
LPVAELLDAAPLTKTHWRTTIVIGLGLFFDIFDVFLAGVLSTVLKKSFGLSPATLPAVLGSSFLGMFFGAMFMGAIADRIGRRPAFLINLGIYSLFTLAGSFSPNAITLIATRFFAGIGIGAQLPLSDAYLSEILPARVRGKLISLAYTIGFCGIPAVGLSARVLVPLTFLGVDGWRWMFVAGSVGGLVVWMLQRYVIESPRWLEAMGRTDEARSVAGSILGEPVESIYPVASATPKQQVSRHSYLSLFAPGIRQRTLMLYVFQIFQTVGYYGFGTMVPLGRIDN